LDFFDPEAIDPKFKNVDAASGTVDIEYNLVEKDLARLNFKEVMVVVDLSVHGTVFQYFSARNILNKEA
jgi:outer membrane protein insertion porin family